MKGYEPPRINPATGLQMMGGVDTMGNLYGCGPPIRHRTPLPIRPPPLRRPPRPPTGPISAPLSFILRLLLLIVVLIYFLPHVWRPTPQALLDAREFVSIRIESTAVALLPSDAARTVITIVQMASR